MMLLHNLNTHQFYLDPDDEQNILFRNTNTQSPFTRWQLPRKGPTSRLKVTLKLFLCCIPDVVCGPIIWRQKLRKVNWVKRSPLLDYKNRKRKTETSISALDNYLPDLASERECGPLYSYNGLSQ